MSDEQIQSAIENDILPKLHGEKAPPMNDAIDQAARQAQVPGGLERFGRGMKDITEGVQQLYEHSVGSPEDAAALDKQIQQENAQYEHGRELGAQPNLSDVILNRKPKPGFDWMRLGGNVAATAPVMFLPGGQATGLARLGGMALQGGAAAAAMPTEGGDFWTQKAIQTGLGTVAGPAIGMAAEKVLLPLGGKVVKPFLGMARRAAARFAGKMPNPNAVFNADGTLTEKGANALKQLGLSLDDLHEGAIQSLRKTALSATKEAKSLTPEQQIRAAMMKDVTGEPATLGQVTRDFAQQQTEQDLKKLNSVGEPLRARFAKQNAGLLDEYGRIKKTVGGVAPNEYQAGQAVADSVKSADAEAQKAVGALYKQVEQDHGGKFGAVPNKLLRATEDASDSEPGLADAVLRRMKRMGIKVEQTNDPAHPLKFDMFEKPFTAADAESLRKFIGGLDTNTPNKRRLVSAMVKALDEDVLKTQGEDAYGIARGVAKQRFKDLEIPAVRAIVDGDVPPEKIYDKFVRRGSIDDLKALKGYMSRGGQDEHGLTPAWNELRTQALEDVFHRATNRAAHDELDNVIFSGAQFRKALNGLGEEKLKLLFSPQELNKLERLSKVAEWRIPMADVLNTSNTNSAWWNMLDRLLAYLPGRAGMVLRGVGRSAQIGVKDIEQQAAADAAMAPEKTVAAEATKAAKQRAAAFTRRASFLAGVPRAGALGLETQRGGQ